MEPARRASLWLLLAVVATLMTSAPALRQPARQHRPAVCEINCCHTYPSCTHATNAVCLCPGVGQMTLGSSVFPATIQNITIASVRNITIDPDAIGQLPHLERLIIKNVTCLKILRHGLRLPTNSKLREFRVSEVHTVTIRDSAFSGTWNLDALVLMESIAVLTVDQKAFYYYSSSVGPSLTFSNVKLLNLASVAILAPIRQLSMRYIGMKVCRPDSIGGNVNRLLLDNVTIGDAKSGCVRADGDDMEQLSIRSCFFGIVHDRAFSGKINYVDISYTIMTSIRGSGFQIKVDKLHINHTRIDELNHNGLTVSAKNTILFNNVRVRSLKRHALFGLKVDRSSTGNPPSIIIRSLYINKTVDGSLAFADCTPVHIEHLQVTRPLSQVCPTERWTRRLVGVSETARLTKPQYQVYLQLARDLPCTNDSYTPLTDGDDADQGCTDGSSGPQGGGGETHETGGSNRPDAAHTVGGSEREDNPHRSSGAAWPTTPSEPAGEDIRSPEDLGGGGGAADRSGQTDTSDGHQALYVGLGLGAALALVTAGCLLVRWRRARAARLACPPHAAAQKTRSVERHRSSADDPHPPSCGTGGWQYRARSEHAGTTVTRDTAHCPPPEICDYAELLPAAPGDGDYAEIPGLADYADPVFVTQGGATKCDDYAEIPPLDCVSGHSVDSHAALTPTKQRAAPLAAAPSSPRKVEHAEVCKSAWVAPPVGGGPADSRESAESVPPPLPPATAERLQMADGMLENVLYDPAQDVSWMCSGKEAQTTPGRE